MTLTDKVARRMGARLTPPERVLHAVPAGPFAGARDVTGPGFTERGWLVLACAQGVLDRSGSPPRSDSSLPLPERCVIALTDRRLSLYSNAALVHAPVDLVYDVPLDQVAWIGASTRESRTARSQRAAAGLSRGSLLAWEFARLYLAPGRALIADLALLVAGGAVPGPAA